MAGRDQRIDVFRGLAIAAMVPVNYLEHVRAAPAWVKHAPDIGLTVADLVAPCFLFAVGLTFPGAVRRRRATEGLQRAGEHVVRRALALLGLGALFSLGETSYGFNPLGHQWGTLQAIGAATLVAAPFVGRSPGARLVIALALLLGYQLALDRLWLDEVLATPQAGLPGALSWGALLIAATAAGDLLATRPFMLPWLGLGTLSAGVSLSFVVPLSKHRMSAPFVLVAFGAAVLLFLVVDVAGRKGLGPRALRDWGQNPLVLYCAHLVLLGAFVVPPSPAWHVEASLPQAAVQFVAYAGLLHALAVGLRRRGVVISL